MTHPISPLDTPYTNRLFVDTALHTYATDSIYDDVVNMDELNTTYVKQEAVADDRLAMELTGALPSEIWS